MKYVLKASLVSKKRITNEEVESKTNLGVWHKIIIKNSVN